MEADLTKIPAVFEQNRNLHLVDARPQGPHPKGAAPGPYLVRQFSDRSSWPEFRNLF